MKAVLDNLDIYVDGFWFTVQLAVLAFAAAMALGALVATMRVSPVAPARVAGAAYVECVRNTPLTVLFVLFWFGFPKFGVRFPSRFGAALIVLSVYTSAFVAEALRSGINAVAAGQAEAARSLGLTFGQTLRHIVLPQALRTVVQPLGSLFIALAKNTSVATVIAVPELMYQTDSLNTTLSEPLWLFAGAGVAYLLLTLPAGVLVGVLERRVAIIR